MIKKTLLSILAIGWLCIGIFAVFETPLLGSKIAGEEAIFLVFLLYSIVSVLVIYIADVFLKFGGMLSYWNWEKLSDEKPATSLSICTNLFIGFILVSLIFLLLEKTSFAILSEFQKIVITTFFIISACMLVISLVSANAFEALSAGNFPKPSKIIIRKVAWYSYLIIVYTTIFLAISLISVVSPIIATITSALFSLFIILYYLFYYEEPIIIVSSEINEKVKEYIALRSSSLTYDVDEFDKNSTFVLAEFRDQVLAGLRLTIIDMETNQSRIPLNKYGISRKKILENIQGRFVCEISGFINGKRNLYENATRALLSSAVNVCKELDVDIIVFGSDKKLVRLYKPELEKNTGKVHTVGSVPNPPLDLEDPVWSYAALSD